MFRAHLGVYFQLAYADTETEMMPDLLCIKWNQQVSSAPVLTRSLQTVKQFLYCCCFSFPQLQWRFPQCKDNAIFKLSASWLWGFLFFVVVVVLRSEQQQQQQLNLEAKKELTCWCTRHARLSDNYQKTIWKHLSVVW